MSPARRAALGSMAPVVTNLAAKLKARPPRTERIAAMDSTDSEILRLLREDARLS
jgi:hypothetical protein